MTRLVDSLCQQRRFREVGLWLAPALLFSIELRAETTLSYEVHGLDGELQRNAELYLDNLPDINLDQFEDHRREITEAIQTSLRALGYYQPTIELELNKKKQ